MELSPKRPVLVSSKASTSPTVLTIIIEDSNVAVFGIGCVGLSILQGARAKKCKRIFAIDTNPSKKEWAMKFGASESS